MFPRLASAVAVCALASVTGACTPSDRDGPGRSASGAPQPLADAGPRPGALRPVWHLDGRKRPASASPVTFDLAGGRLLVKTGDRITLHDARTGAARWHYTEPGLQVGAHAATRATLVVAMRTATSTSHLVGLDAGDGRRLWERKDVSPGRTDVIPAGAGVVAVIEKAGEVVGIDASTGRERWTWEGDPALDCRLGLPWLSGPNPVDGVILVRESCYPGDAAVDPARSIRALDPATGRSLWRRPAPAESNVRAESRRGVTMLRTGSWGTEGVAILGRDGRELLKQGRVPRCPADTCFEVAGEWVIVPYGEPGAQRAIHVV